MALVTGLVLLAVLSILGVTAMRSSTQGTKLAVNHQHKQQSFQAAENALTKMMGDEPGNVAPTTLTPGNTRAHPDPDDLDPSPYFESSGVDHQADVSANLSVTYVETRTNLLISGFEVNATGYVYEADATGRVDGTGAQATNRMGIALIR